MILKLLKDLQLIVFQKKYIEGMISEPIWRDLPAVKKGNVYFISGALGISTDPWAREKLIEDLPGILRK
ncbi:hypothetical protein [Paenibacillus sp. OSY-SE]|uniref:hypothetical protein n=1 Tax=Paenibacillus sp. OSY-SE TaxID=1196323 RepID=UPI00037D9821|nr:hypothetical protein [Paenibacillus sp. OSY-SE]